MNTYYISRALFAFLGQYDRLIEKKACSCDDAYEECHCPQWQDANPGTDPYWVCASFQTMIGKVAIPITLMTCPESSKSKAQALVFRAFENASMWNINSAWAMAFLDAVEFQNKSVAVKAWDDDDDDSLLGEETLRRIRPALTLPQHMENYYILGPEDLYERFPEMNLAHWAGCSPNQSQWFGVLTPEQAAQLAEVCERVVVTDYEPD